MSAYLLVFRVPKGHTPSADSAPAWLAWHQSLGALLKDRGNPVYRSAIVGGMPGDTELRGYSLVRAADLDSALSLAEGCPAIGAGGIVEVGELTNTDELFEAYLAERAVA